LLPREAERDRAREALEVLHEFGEDRTHADRHRCTVPLRFATMRRDDAPD